ncbi:MAG: SIS domain-containing protein [Anaerolineae bacterium]|nr:SIS domain-containing protein [Anaerolineae bacterium]
MSHLESEIYEQPQVIGRLLDSESDHIREIARIIHTFKPAFVCIAARGTSDNAARYAQYALGIHARMPVALATPSIHTLYNAAPDLSRALVIGISQSGMAADVTRVVSDARMQGALTLSVTNNPDSPLAKSAEHHIALHAGEEISVAATKTYTAQLTVIAMLVAALANDPVLDADLLRLTEQVTQTLELAAPVQEFANRNVDLESFAALGRAYNYCTAIETCLKVQELCYVIGQGYSEADFLHGPIAIVKPEFPVIVFAPRGKSSANFGTLLAKLRERSATTLLITNDAGFGMDTWVRLPNTLPEWLSPIAAVLPGQLFGMYLALAKGNPVDKPKGLSKVTVTL